MKTDYLKEIGLNTEQIDKVMAENGRDIEAYKSKITNIEAVVESLKQEVELREGQLTELRKINPEKLGAKIKELEEENLKIKTETAKKLLQSKKETEVSSELRKQGCQSIKLAMPVIDFSKITVSEDGKTLYGVEDIVREIRENEETKLLFENAFKPIGKQPRDSMENPPPVSSKKPYEMSYAEFLESGLWKSN